MGIYSPHLDSRDIVAGFYPALEAGMEAIWAPRIAKITPSSSETELYRWLGQVPAMRKWVGARQEQQLAKYTLSVTNYLYESTLPIPLDDLRRDKTGQLRQRAADLGTRTATHWNKIASEWINVADAATLGLCYDGQFLFDTDHNESGSNQSNDLTVTEIPNANVTTTASPTATECANILNEVAAYFTTLTDDQGEPVNQEAMSIMVMTSRHGQAAGFAQAIANAQQSLTTTLASDNAVVGLTRQGWGFEVQNNPRLTAGEKVFFFLTGGGVNSGLILQDEEGVTTQLLGPGSDEEFNNNRHVFGVKATRGVGYGMWQKCIMVTLS
jgi:phage major head subunit gpT-like protein